MKNSAIITILVLITNLLLIFPASAQNPDKYLDLVWGIEGIPNLNQLSVYSPSEIPKIYLLSDETYMFQPRNTYVYYWPFDREYKPDWASLNVVLEGTLQITDENDIVITTISKTPYIFQPVQTKNGYSLELIQNSDALAVYNENKVLWDRYLSDLKDYEETLGEYLDLQNQDSNQSANNRPVPPEKPISLVVPPSSAFPIKLPSGVYHISLIDSDGIIVPKSERTIYSVSPISFGVGYSVIPESKWTRPEVSNEKSEIIYYSPTTDSIYLIALRIAKYNEQAFARHANPQDTLASEKRTVWIHLEPIANVFVQISTDGEIVETIEKEPFIVEQIPGATLGYKVLPYLNGQSGEPDFEGYHIPAIAGVSRITVSLIDSNGNHVEGGDRTLIRARDNLPIYSWFLPILPFLIAIMCEVSRRNRRSRSKDIIERLA